uniref:2,4-dienoyl-CoA reductase [(3E)-enoyl-CoA-producing] n=1 Tax=Nephromyces sp. MMRI TaxID=2496275 RepID=A0A3Q8UBV9_9APIC|nr:2,4-dienoyl-CoA reductase 2 [Nephromyces sp. MMRI]
MVLHTSLQNMVVKYIYFLVTKRSLSMQKKCIEDDYGVGVCEYTSGDVRTSRSVEEGVLRCIDVFKRINILINCAAGNFICDILNLSVKGFKTVLEIDTVGTFIASKHVYTHALQHTGGGVIINISMTLHYTGTHSQIHAGAAKAAIDAMTKHMAVEFGHTHVNVNSIAPGPILNTQGIHKLTLTNNQEGPNELLDALKESIPLKRLGTVDDLANTALFLSTKEANYITGSIIVVDGGHWLNGTSSFLNPLKKSSL